MVRSRQVPVDILAVGGATLASMAVIVAPEFVPPALRVPAGFLLVLFAPGYAVLAALFPRRGFRQVPPTTGDDPALDDNERIVLAVPISVGVSVGTGFALTLTPMGIQYGPLAVVLGGSTLAGLAVNAYRREGCPAAAGPSSGAPDISQFDGELSNTDTTVDSLLRVGLVVAIVLGVGIIAYPFAVPTQGEAYTSMGLYTEEANGTLVSTNYPTNLSIGESTPLVLSVTNDNSEPIEYTVVVLLQNRPDGSDRIRNETRLHTFSKRVEGGDEWEIHHTVTATMTGERLRLQYLLYEQTPPAAPTVGNADQEIHLWVHISNRTSPGDSSLRRGNMP